MRKWSQFTELWQGEDAVTEFARAVAFANVDLDAPDAEWAMGAPIEDRGPYFQTCRYVPFRDEIARALRLPPKEPPHTFGMRPIRPIYGLERVGAVREAQVAMRKLLASILEGDAPSIVRQLSGCQVDLNVAGVGEGRSMQLGVHYYAARGYSNILYGVILAGERGWWRRLTRCRACTRFIAGRTDRPVRYCAAAECQAHSAKPKGKAPSRDAAYQRAHRDRVRKWRRFLNDIVAAQRGHGPERGPARWESLSIRGRKLLKECFKRPGSARDAAEKMVSLVEGRLGLKC